MPITLTEAPFLRSFEVFVADSAHTKFDIRVHFRAWHGHLPVDAAATITQVSEPLPGDFWTVTVPNAVSEAYEDLGYELP